MDKAGSIGDNENTRGLADSSSVRTVIKRYDANGVTESDFSSEYLVGLKAHLLAGIQKEWDQEKVPGAPTATGAYVLAGSHKLAVVELKADGAAPVVLVTGVLGREIIQITCAWRESGEVLQSFACQKAISESFGAKVMSYRG